MPMLLYLVLFLVLIAVSVPIAFALGVSSVVVFILTNQPLDLLAQRLFTGLNTFTLVAIPLFILTGELMSVSGILEKLLNFSRLILGKIKGALLYINIIGSMFFGGVNGSAVADTSAIGSMLIPASKREYKDPELVASITAISSITGPLIPPSVPMLIYAFAASNVSVSGLFLAGIIPGILIGIGMLIVTYFIVKKKDYPVPEASNYTGKDVLKIIGWFLVALVLPVIMIMGIVSGVMTPTEAGCIGVIYSVLIGFFVTRELTLESLYQALYKTTLTSAIVMIMVSIGHVAIWWLTMEGLPRIVGDAIESFTSSAWIFLLLILIIYLFVGLFIDQTPAMIMLVPIFAPMAVSFGIDPIHFGIVTVFALAIGLVTPPVGICLFVSSSIANVPILNVFKASKYYFVGLLITLLIVTFIPEVYMWIPKMFGF